MSDLFDQLADQHPTLSPAPAPSGGKSTFDSLADAHQSTGDGSGSGSKQRKGLFGGTTNAEEGKLIGDTSYGDIVKNPNNGFFHKAGQLSEKVLQEAGQGTANAIESVPGMISGAVQGMMPTKAIPVPGGQMSEDLLRGGLKAMDLARKGQYTKAAKATPVVGGMFDYATSHPIADTVSNFVTGAGLAGAGGKLVQGTANKLGLGEVPTAPSVYGETPAVKQMLEVFKPSNGVKAIDDYNVVVPRLLREHPNLASGKATLPEIQEALDQTMHENRHYAEAHIGPAKSSRMQIDLNPVADAINKNISSVMERNAPAQADAMREIANRYRGKTDVADVEGMMHELNAKVSDMRKMNPGEWSQTTQASASKAFLDATTKAMRKVYNDGLENFTGSPAVAQLNREYGTMMGFRQDMAGLIQDELVRNSGGSAGVGGKILAAGKAVVNPKKAIANAALEALSGEGPSGNIPKLQQALKNYRGPQAPDYPTPPIYAGPGGTSGSPGNIPPGTYPGARPVPAGAFPGSNPGPTAGYTQGPAGPIPQRKLLGGATPGQKAPLVTPPPADTSGPIPNAGPRPGAGMGQQVGERTLPAPAQEQRPTPGEHYGGDGMAPVNQADVVHPSVKQHNVGMVPVSNPEGGRVWVPEGTQGQWIWSKNPAGRWELIDKNSLSSGKLSPASELPKRKK